MSRPHQIGLGVSREDAFLAIGHQVGKWREDLNTACVNGFEKCLRDLIGDLASRVEAVCSINHVPDEEGLVEQEVSLHANAVLQC